MLGVDVDFATPVGTLMRVFHPHVT